MCAFFKYFKYYSQNNQTHRNISKYHNNYVHKNLQPCLIFYKFFFIILKGVIILSIVLLYRFIFFSKTTTKFYEEFDRKWRVFKYIC